MKLPEDNKKKIIILRCALAVLLLLIWGHSMMSAGASNEESDALTEFFKPFFEIFVGRGNVTPHLVRKTAHFTEFSALGVLLGSLLQAHRKKTLFYQSYAFLFGVGCALVDETIQLFSEGRSSEVADVLLDGAGVLTGLALCAVIFLAARLVNNKRAA